jgi:predicted porin
MQKKIIALAVAGLMSGAAFAQSNVTVYGIVDMYYAHGSADVAAGTQDSANYINGGGLSGSRIGFRGTEDLGNGNKALFVAEYTIVNDANDGLGASAGDASGNKARQQLVGLTGSWGTAVAGYAQTAGYDWSCATGAVAGTGLDAAGKLSLTNNTLLNCGKSGRAGNAVAYISPNMSGFTVAYNHARLTEYNNVANTDDGTANILSGDYTNGPISAGLIWAKQSNDQTVARDDIKEWGLRGSYDFGVAKLFASWQSNDSETASGKNKRWQITGSMPVGAAGTAILTYGKSSIGETAADDDAKAWTVAYLHALSKRTTAYAGYNRVNNNTAATNKSIITPIAGGDSSALIVGLRHSF